MKLQALLLLVLFPAAAHCADWRAFASVKENDALLLYSAPDVKHDGTHVRVWTEALKASEVMSFDVNAHPDTMKRVFDRIKNHYRPPLADFGQHLEGFELANLVLAEEVADEHVYEPIVRGLYEIDCSSDRTRVLEAIEKSGRTSSDLQWTYIAPDTPVAWLEHMVCPSQH